MFSYFFKVTVHLQYVSMGIYHHEFGMLKSCRNAKLTGLMNSGWPGSDSCSFSSLVVLISSCPFGDVFFTIESYCKCTCICNMFQWAFTITNLSCSKFKLYFAQTILLSTCIIIFFFCLFYLCIRYMFCPFAI